MPLDAQTKAYENKNMRKKEKVEGKWKKNSK